MWAHRLPAAKIIRVTVFYVLLAVLLYVSYDTLPLQLLQRPFYAAAVPVVQRTVAVKHALASLGIILEKIPQSAQNELLYERKYNELLALRAQLASLQEENTRLRDELTLGQKSYPRVTGTLIAVNEKMVVVIDQPKTLATGSLVTVGGNLVGEISSKRTERIYEVLPTVNPTFKAKVVVVHDGSNVDGIIEGQFARHMKLTKVLSTATIAKEDLVLLNDDQKVASERFVVGKIVDVKKDETQVFKEASVLPLFDATKSQTVFVEVLE